MHEKYLGVHHYGQANSFWRHTDFKSALCCFWWFSPLSRPNSQRFQTVRLSKIIATDSPHKWAKYHIVCVKSKMLGLAWLNSKAILFSLWNLHLLITTMLSYWKITILGNCDTVDTLRKIYYPGSQCPILPINFWWLIIISNMTSFQYSSCVRLVASFR